MGKVFDMSLFQWKTEAMTMTLEGNRIQRFSPFNVGKLLDKYPMDLELVPKPWGNGI